MNINIGVHGIDNKEKNMSVDVKIYSLSTCSHCKAAKKLLDDLMVTYDATNIDQLSGQERTDALDQVKKLNPQTSFPTIRIGEQVIIGFREAEIKRALGL